MANHPLASRFSGVARRVSQWLGTWYSFLAAALVVLVWAAWGPFCAYSSTWQLVINTGTTIVTFLMVFLLQNTQNHDSRAIHLKLDEIIHALKRADDRLIGAQELSEERLQQLDHLRRGREPE